MEEKMLRSGKQIPAKTMKTRNSVQKEVTNQHSDRSMIKETPRWPIKIQRPQIALALRARAILLVFEKFNRAYLFQIALEIT